MKPSPEIQQDIILDKLNRLESQLLPERVSREEFEAVQKAVYSVIAMILLAVFFSIISLLVPHDAWRDLLGLFR